MIFKSDIGTVGVSKTSILCVETRQTSILATHEMFAVLTGRTSGVEMGQVSAVETADRYLLRSQDRYLLLRTARRT